MEVIKKIKSHQDQFFSHVIEYNAGDKSYNDSPVGDGVTTVPHNVRLSIDSEETIRLHTENINNYKERSIVFSPQLQLFSKPKDSTQWGLFPDQQRDWRISEFFETENNDIIIPMNRRVEELRARIGNTKLLDEHNYISDYWHTQLPSRPSTVEYKNDCTVICVSFVPRPDIEWKCGAWIQYDFDGPKRIEKKGSSIAYIVTAKDTELLDGTKIVAGVAYRMNSPLLEFIAGTNIILHIHD